MTQSVGRHRIPFERSQQRYLQPDRSVDVFGAEPKLWPDTVLGLLAAQHQLGEVAHPVLSKLFVAHPDLHQSDVVQIVSGETPRVFSESAASRVPPLERRLLLLDLLFKQTESDWLINGHTHTPSAWMMLRIPSHRAPWEVRDGELIALSLGLSIYNDFQRGFRTAIGMLCRSPAKELCNCNATEVDFLLGQILVRALQQSGSNSRRDGREAEGGGLLNRYRVKSSIGGSNPPLSASESSCLLSIT